MKKTSRWMKSILAASAEPQPGLPWQRATRRMPAALAAAPKAKPAAAAN
ncbi:hypothetical protein [Solirhodobacter olei]|jgi:hypothetical protein|nr:hypothetical protein [Solirhodobacter olei]